MDNMMTEESCFTNKRYHIGYTCGVFDLLHVGHLNLFERCKNMCDFLIVGVCDDDYVINKKNKTPIFSQEDRVRILSSLKLIDDVILVNTKLTEDKILVWDKYKFDVLFSGDDWKGSDRFKRTEIEFAKIGVSVEYFPYTAGVSTTLLKQKFSNEK